MVEEHLLGEGGALAQGEQFQDAVFLAGQVQRLGLDLDRSGIEIDRQLAGLDDRFRVSLGAAHDRLDARQQFAPVERLGQVVVRAEAETLGLVVKLGKARQDQDRRIDARGAQAPQHLVAVDVRQHQIEDDDVVIVKLTNLETVFAQVGRIDDVSFGLKDQFDALGGVGIVFNQQHTHDPKLLGVDSSVINTGLY